MSHLIFEGEYIMELKLKAHTFKFRTGDTDEKGGCTFIGGSWVDKTTDELFKGKRVVLFSLVYNCIYTDLFRSTITYI